MLQLQTKKTPKRSAGVVGLQPLWHPALSAALCLRALASWGMCFILSVVFCDVEVTTVATGMRSRNRKGITSSSCSVEYKKTYRGSTSSWSKLTLASLAIGFVTWLDVSQDSHGALSVDTTLSWNGVGAAS